MLTIGRLAEYTGVTVATVRHYHRVGLLPEPERDLSGYRTYDAAAVVRLLRIRVLAEAGVPLSRVEELLDASAEDFAEGVRVIDRRLRADIRRLEATRKKLAQLAAGDHLALPPSVLGYLDRLRELGVTEDYLALERDGWILLTAEAPDQIDAIIEGKHATLDDPDMMQLYRLVGDGVHWTADDPRLVELADILARQWQKMTSAQGARDYGLGDTYADLMDSTVEGSGPAAQRLLDLLRERGWTGWARPERCPDVGEAAR